MSWLGRATPGSEIHPRVLPALQTRARVSAHVRDTSHTWPVPSPAAAPLWTRRLGGREPGSGSHSPGGHSPPPGWEHRATPSATRAGRSSPWETAAAARGSRARRPHCNPPGDHYRRRGLFKAEGGTGTLPAPREDTTHCNPSTARPSAQSRAL